MISGVTCTTSHYAFPASTPSFDFQTGLEALFRKVRKASKKARKVELEERWKAVCVAHEEAVVSWKARCEVLRERVVLQLKTSRRSLSGF